MWNRYFKMFCVNDDDMLCRYHPGPKSVKYIINFGSLLSLAFWLCAICNPITFLRNATLYNKVMYPPSLCHDMMTSCEHYGDVIMSAMASQITSLMIAYSIVYLRRSKQHKSSASLTFVWGINRWPVNSLHKGPVTRKMFPFDDVIVRCYCPHWMISADIWR